jgi:hypothetical protein
MRVKTARSQTEHRRPVGGVSRALENGHETGSRYMLRRRRDRHSVCGRLHDNNDTTSRRFARGAQTTRTIDIFRIYLSKVQAA